MILTPTTGATKWALTPRQLEVLRWTCEGKTMWEISRIMGVKTRTVAFHIERIREQLNVPNTMMAVKWYWMTYGFDEAESKP